MNQQQHNAAEGMDHIGMQSKTLPTERLHLTVYTDRMDQLQEGEKRNVPTSPNAAQWNPGFSHSTSSTD